MTGLTLFDTAFVACLKRTPDTIPQDDFESYTAAADLDTLNAGLFWAAAYTARGEDVPAIDDFESYLDTDDLDSGLNGGIAWAAAYTSRENPFPSSDDFETYSDTDDLDTLNDGVNWDGAYVSR